MLVNFGVARDIDAAGDVTAVDSLRVCDKSRIFRCKAFYGFSAVVLASCRAAEKLLIFSKSFHLWGPEQDAATALVMCLFNGCCRLLSWGVGGSGAF